MKIIMANHAMIPTAPIPDQVFSETGVCRLFRWGYREILGCNFL